MVWTKAGVVVVVCYYHKFKSSHNTTIFLKTGISSYVSYFVNTLFGLPRSVLPAQNQWYICSLWCMWYIDKFEYERWLKCLCNISVSQVCVILWRFCGRIWSVLAASHQVGSFPQQPRSGIVLSDPSPACKDTNSKLFDVVTVADIYIMMHVCLFVTKNEHFLLGVSCNHLNPP